MSDDEHLTDTLSPWWRNAVILILIGGFPVLIWVAARSCEDAPPIPLNVMSTAGTTLFTRADVLAGQRCFSSTAPWRMARSGDTAATSGPDFSAACLHALAVDTAEFVVLENFKRSLSQLTALERAAVNAEASGLLKENRYRRESKTLTFTPAEEASYGQQVADWRTYVLWGMR